MQYYEDYFDEAGPENEQQVINDLGSPERVAAIIKAGLDTTYLKIFSSIILALCLMIPRLKEALNLKTGLEKGE